jgi:AAA domain, putative AbiEii toxin, Type IV TA system
MGRVPSKKLFAESRDVHDEGQRGPLAGYNCRPVFVSRLILKNWRNFRDVDVALADRVFVVGPNASGKSNFLDSLRFLRDVARAGGGLQRAITARGGLSKIRCLAARKEPNVEVTVELTEYGQREPVWRYSLGMEQEPRGYRRPILSYERVESKGKVLLERPDKNDHADEERLTQTHLEQIAANASFRAVAKVLESVRYLHLVPQLLRHPESFQVPSGMDDPFGRSFLDAVVKTPEKTRRSRLRKIEAALRSVVPQLRNLTDTKDDSGVPH